MRHGWKAALSAIVIAVATSLAGPAIAKEVAIGSAVYEPRPQRDVVEVGGREGAFKAIRFEVRGNDVEVLGLRVVYGNGSTEDINVRQVFRAGSSSRIIDLAGRQRAIRQIVVTYMAKGPARIQFFGVEGAAQTNWERLGCKEVNFGVDRDTLRVGRSEGTFRAIRLKVRHAPVEFYDLRVVFGNGRSESFRVRAVVPAGGESRAIDLDGKTRGIDRIEMIYRSIPSYKGKAEVCVEGLQR